MRAAVVVLLVAGSAAAAPVPKPRPPDPYGHGYLGIRFADGGLGVGEVTPGGPADAAGLRPGDVFVAVGPLAPRSRTEIQLYVGNARPGTRVRVVVDRGGTPVVLAATLGRMPDDVEEVFTSTRRQARGDADPDPDR